MNSSDPTTTPDPSPTTSIDADPIDSSVSSPRTGHTNWDAVAGATYVEFRNLVLASLNQPLDNLRYWSVLALGLAILSAVMVLAGVGLAYYDTGSYVAILSAASSGASIIASISSTVVSKYLANARDDVAKTRQEVLRLFRDFGRRVFGESEPSVYIYATPDANVGRFERVTGGEWVEVSMKEAAAQTFRFTSRREGDRVLLRDSQRKIDVEIDQENRQVFWIKGNERAFLYKVIGVH